MMTNLQVLILPRLSLISRINNDAIIEKLIDLDELKTTLKFTGTIHCEAPLMALVHSFSVEELPKRILPFSQEMIRKLGPIFSVRM
jgi:hypothetical protein